MVCCVERACVRALCACVSECAAARAGAGPRGGSLLRLLVLLVEARECAYIFYIDNRECICTVRALLKCPTQVSANLSTCLSNLCVSAVLSQQWACGCILSLTEQ